ncbi:hypothetical protein ACMGE7_10505 [Macrococcus equi]|uniref:hypothetical protein n=1 Tax=Macrococcus equi TaxID=3395462 RepID=UPI0039BDEFE6
MDFCIYFDESIKLDQPSGNHSYYGALGGDKTEIDEIIKEIKDINNDETSKSELHFVNYTSDNHFGKYFKILHMILNKNIKINIVIVNKQDAHFIADRMNISISELRELFYVKLPERLFYGMTRNLKLGEQVEIIIDKNSEYEKIDLDTKLEEQMNAHSAYKKKDTK